MTPEERIEQMKRDSMRVTSISIYVGPHELYLSSTRTPIYEALTPEARKIIDDVQNAMIDLGVKLLNDNSLCEKPETVLDTREHDDNYFDSTKTVTINDD